MISLELSFIPSDLKRKVLIAFATAFGAVALGFFHFVYQPMHRSAVLTESALTQAKTQQTALMELVGSQRKAASHSRYFIDSPDITPLIKILNTSAEKAGLELLSLQPTASEPAKPLKKFEINLTARGGYNALGEFVGALENETRFVKVASLRMETAKEENRGGASMQFSMVVSSLKKSTGEP